MLNVFMYFPFRRSFFRPQSPANWPCNRCFKSKLSPVYNKNHATAIAGENTLKNLKNRDYISNEPVNNLLKRAIMTHFN